MYCQSSHRTSIYTEKRVKKHNAYLVVNLASGAKWKSYQTSTMYQNNKKAIKHHLSICYVSREKERKPIACLPINDITETLLFHGGNDCSHFYIVTQNAISIHFSYISLHWERLNWYIKVCHKWDAKMNNQICLLPSYWCLFLLRFLLKISSMRPSFTNQY